MTRLILAVIAFAVLAACGKQDHAEAPRAADSEAAETASTGEGDPCSLLEQKEVEAALGPLAGAPYREGSDGPEAGGGKCVYETRDLRRLVIHVTWSEASTVMRMLGLPADAAQQAGLRGKLPLPDGVTMTGEWDEAKALSCCEITALLGDQAVGIDFMATELSASRGVELLNAALRRLAMPLETHGDEGVTAAQQRAQSRAGRPPVQSACALITAADATALLGPVETLPEDNDRKCEYRSKGKPALVSLTVEWSGGFRKWRSDRDLATKSISALMGNDAKNSAAAPAAAAPEYPGPWEKADVVVTDFVAVRDDVIMHIDIRGTSLDNAKALMTQAFGRVAWP